MARLLRVIALISSVLMVINGAAALKGIRSRLDCSGVFKSSYEQVPNECEILPSWQPNPEKPELESFYRIEMAELCLCSLLRHSLNWQFLLTHEVETMYRVLRKVIEKMATDEAANTKKSTGMVKADHVMFEMDPTGNMYFYDKLDSLLHNLKRVRLVLASPFYELFARVYYDPDVNFELHYDEDDFSNNLFVDDVRSKLGEVCNQVYNNFRWFLVYLERLKLFTHNNRFMFRVANYDEDLFKIVNVVKFCQTLHEIKDIALTGGIVQLSP